MKNFIDLYFYPCNPLSNFVGGFIVLFSVLTILYSCGFMKGKKGQFRYYLYTVLTLVASVGAVYSRNLVVFIVFWGFLGLLLYLLIGFGGKDGTSATAKKAFIIIGGTDALMLLGLALVWRLGGTLQMDEVSLTLTSKKAIVAYLCLAAGALAKAGAMPFHTWVPDTADDAPAPVTAFLPASLDKLLGIYFLARISLDVFQMSPAMNTVLLVVGSVTIVAAVMMALIQHDLKRLLGYHAVSQVGYMVLGIGTGNPVGIAGGLFHMLNHAIYKSCLFFGSGAVEKKAGTTNLDKLGGLAKGMPIIFWTFLIASFAISGIPPFNGFFSKWMVYQGIIETAKSGGFLWVFWLVAAQFGSALTLASFMKLVHAVFLGQPSQEQAASAGECKEPGFTMWIPTVLLAFLCVLFGVLAYRIPLKMFIFPSLGDAVAFSGMWRAGLATALVVIAILIGCAIYWIGSMMKTRETGIFLGGEAPERNPEMRISGTEFYRTIQDIGLLRAIYSLAERKCFDIYDVCSKATFGINKVFRALHNGVLPTYMAWCLLGMIVLFFYLIR